ncbi:MAG: Type 1 glutamine amidotransferase-like domain-containing protein, partial [Rickettsia endosymbiont of Ixodes persulcatus]|nr:Type 1 glutamine amidotransferase-like domain-containing protein [Rickettsia endosymbiont of Ixodes persulcatus]
MGALVLLSGFTENDNVNLKIKMKKIFLDKKYTVSFIPSITDKEQKEFEVAKNSLSEYGDFNFNYFDIDDFCDIDKIEKIFESDVIYLSSGNTYYFLNNLKKRYLITRLRKYIEKGGC